MHVHCPHRTGALAGWWEVLGQGAGAGQEPAWGPVLEPRRGSSAWDNRVVGTPFVVRVPGGGAGAGGGGCFRMYYIGTGFGEQGETTTGIGCVESVGGSLAEWRRVPPV